MKNNVKNVIIAVLVLVIGLLCFYIKTDKPDDSDTSTSNIVNVVNENLPKNVLPITTDFLTVSDPVFNDDSNSIEFSIALTNNGLMYMETGLFINQYSVYIEIYDNETNESYFLQEASTWDVLTDQHYKLELSEYIETIENKLDKVESTNKHTLVTRVSLTPVNYDSNELRYISMLSYKK